MISSGSYELSTFSTGIKAEMKRLDSQIDLFWPKEINLYSRWGLGNGLSIVDLGCGTGHLIDKLSKEFPLSKFTGVEQDPMLADAAKQKLQNNNAIQMIHTSSIENFISQNLKYDVAIMRLVLEHVPDPNAVLTHIHSLLKPDGRIILIDNDFEYHLCTYPEITELKDLYKAYCRSRINDGGNPCIGRNLPLLLKSNGFCNIDLDILSAHSQLIGDIPFLSSEGAGIPTQLAKSGFLDENILHSLVAKWRDMLSNSHHCLYRQLFAATGCAGSFQLSSCNINKNVFHSPEKKSAFSVNTQNYTDFLHDLISLTLNVKGDELDKQIPLIDAGLDSVGAMDIQAAIQERFNVELPITALLGGATYSEITEILRNKINCSSSDYRENSSQSSDIEESGTL